MAAAQQPGPRKVWRLLCPGAPRVGFTSQVLQAVTWCLQMEGLGDISSQDTFRVHDHSQSRGLPRARGTSGQGHLLTVGR